jgi:hypothetical protein
VRDTLHGRIDSPRRLTDHDHTTPPSRPAFFLFRAVSGGRANQGSNVSGPDTCLSPMAGRRPRFPSANGSQRRP